MTEQQKQYILILDAILLRISLEKNKKNIIKLSREGEKFLFKLQGAMQ